MCGRLINKVTITPANTTDAEGFQHVRTNAGAVYADKGYCLKPAKNAAKYKCVHLAAIKKNNMKEKNKDLDRWISTIGTPYERIFSQQNKRVRYVGIMKNQFAAFIQAMVFNLKRIAKIHAGLLDPPGCWSQRDRENNCVSCSVVIKKSRFF